MPLEEWVSRYLYERENSLTTMVECTFGAEEPMIVFEQANALPHTIESCRRYERICAGDSTVFYLDALDRLLLQIPIQI